MGYQLVWRHRWLLLGAVALPLVPALLIGTVVDLIWTGGATTIVNGSLVSASHAGPAAWAALIALVLGWGLAVMSGVVVVAGAQRGVLVRPAQAVRAGLRRIRGLTLVLVGMIVTGFFLTFLLASVAVIFGGLGVAVLVVGLVAVAFLLCRMLFALPMLVLEPDRDALAEAFGVTRRRVLPTAGAFLLGAVAATWLVTIVLAQGKSMITRGMGLDGPAAIAVSTALSIGSDAWVVIVTAVQAAVLAAAYLQRRTGDLSEPEADVGRIDAHLRVVAGSAPTGGQPMVAVLVVALPALVAAAVTLWNPYGAVHAKTRVAESLLDVRHATWPGDTSPVFASGHMVYDCADDGCARTDWRLLGNWRPWDDGAAFDDDGVLISATAMSRNIVMQRCAPGQACERAAVFGSPTMGADLHQPSLAVGAAPDGTVWLASALDGEGEIGPVPEVQLALTRCADWTCSDRVTTQFGTVEAWPPDGLDPFSDASLGDEWGLDEQPSPPSSRVLTVDTDLDGRPVVAFRGGAEVWLGTCTPDDCTSPRLERHLSIGRNVLPLGTVDDGALSWSDSGQLDLCVREQCMNSSLPGVPPATPLGELALKVTPVGLLALVAEPVSPPGFHVTFGDGAPPEQWLTSLIHCRDLLCEDSSRMPLTYDDEPPQATAMLVGADRRVFVRTSGSGEGTTITLRLPGE